jgi:FkbM family methyltransferase
MVSPEEVTVALRGRAFTLNGRPYGLVTALIDGERSEEAIVEALGDELTPERVYYLLEILRRSGFLAEDSEPPYTRKVLLNLTAVDCLLDIGCNRGQFLITALRWWKPSRAVAVDMQPDVLECARQNVALCRLPTRVDFIPCAVGPEAGEAEYWKSDFSPVSSLLPKSEYLRRELGLETVPDRLERCPVRTIDEISRETGLQRIDLLKIDIEGYELPALMGAEETLRHTNHVLAEVYFGGIRPHGFEAVAAFLRKQGFTPTEMLNTFHAHSGELLVADVLFRRGKSSKTWMAF